MRDKSEGQVELCVGVEVWRGLIPLTLHWNFFIRLGTLQNKGLHLITFVLLLHCEFADSAVALLRVHDSVFSSKLYMKCVRLTCSIPVFITHMRTGCVSLQPSFLLAASWK